MEIGLDKQGKMVALLSKLKQINTSMWNWIWMNLVVAASKVP